MTSAEQAASPDTRERFRAGELEAVVNQQGAYLEELNFNGIPLLVPHFINQSGKPRGGVFATLPYFGPGAAFKEFGLNRQHGFTRDEQWEKVKTPPIEGLRRFGFIADGKYGKYDGFQAYVSYQLGRDILGNPKLESTIICANESEFDLPVAPGFHFYFPRIDKNGVVKILPRSRSRNIGTKDYTLASLNEAVEIGRNVEVVQFNSNGSLVTICSEGLPVPVLWSDSPEYGCVEPTLTGAINSPEEIKQRNIMFPKGRMYQFGTEITWQALP